MRRLRSLAARFTHGGLGVIFAVFVPRVWSTSTQWLLAAVAGAPAVAAYVNTTARASLAMAFVSAALAPTLAARPAQIASARSRALTARALAVLAAAASTGMLLYEVTLGEGFIMGAFGAAFAAAGIFQGPSSAIWPRWQREGRYATVLGVMFIALTTSWVAALLRQPQAAAVAMGIGGAVPCVAMWGRANNRRALRVALWILKRSLPVSLLSAATSAVFPLALSQGAKVLGNGIVGRQILFWSVVMALDMAGQALAARALAKAAPNGVADRGAAFFDWLPSGVALSILGALAFLAFRVHFGAATIPPALGISCLIFVLSDPICFFFCQHHRASLSFSLAAAVLVAVALFFQPAWMLLRLSVYGPSATIALVRLFTVRESGLRYVPLSLGVAFTIAYAVGILL